MMLHKKPVKAYEGENRGYPRRGIGDREPVARVLGGRVQSNQRGDAGRVDALNGRQIQIEGLPAYKRFQMLQQTAIAAANQFGQLDGIGGLMGGNRRLGCGVVIRDRHNDLLWESCHRLRAFCDLSWSTLSVNAFGAPKRPAEKMVKSQGIGTIPFPLPQRPAFN